MAPRSAAVFSASASRARPPLFCRRRRLGRGRRAAGFPHAQTAFYLSTRHEQICSAKFSRSCLAEGGGSAADRLLQRLQRLLPPASRAVIRSRHGQEAESCTIRTNEALRPPPCRDVTASLPAAGGGGSPPRFHPLGSVSRLFSLI